MRLRLLYWIGKGLIGKRKFQVWFSMLGVAVGVSALIVALSLSRGFSNSFLQGILNVLSHVTVTSPGDYIYAPDQLCEQIRKLDSVKACAPIIEGQALIESDAAVAGIRVYGCNESIEDVIASGRKIIVKKEEKRPNAYKGLVIGQALAKSLSVKKGDQIKITGPDSEILVKVEALFRSGMYDYEASFVYMSLDQSRKLFDVPDDTATTVLVQCNSSEDSIKVADQIKELGKGFLNPRTWQQGNASLVSAFAMEKRVLNILVFFILLVSAFAASGVMSIIVSERADEIAYLKAMGFKGRQITGAFVLSGVFIGLAGSVAGGVAGLLTAWYLNASPIDLPADVYFIPKLQAQVCLGEVIYVMAAAVICLILSSAVPAWRAGRLDPVKVFRKND